MKDSQRKPTPDSRGEDEGFLSRWSRLKSQGSVEEDSRDGDSAETGKAEVAPTPDGEAYLPGDEDMPPLDTLDEDSDYSQFMSPRVSEELRRLALRKLFHTPSFHVRDGLDDYDEDFTTFTPLGDTITADMKFHAAQERLKQALQDEQVATQTAAPELHTVAEPDPQPGDDAGRTMATTTAAPEDAQGEPWTDADRGKVQAAESRGVLQSHNEANQHRTDGVQGKS